MQYERSAFYLFDHLLRRILRRCTSPHSLRTRTKHRILRKLARNRKDGRVEKDGLTKKRGKARDADRKDVNTPSRQIEIASVGREFRSLPLVDGVVEQVLEAMDLITQRREGQAQSSLALMIGEIHRDREAPRRSVLPEISNEAVVRPIAFRRRQALHKLPSAVSSWRMTKSCKQPRVKSCQCRVNRF